MILECIEFLHARLKIVSFLFFLALAIIAIWSLTVDLHHAHTWAEKKVPCFWALFALLAGIVLVFFSRWFRGCGITVREDYYDN